MTEKEYFEQALEVSTEFDRYIFAHPDIAEKIPLDALIVFILENNPEFSERSMELAKLHREKEQPVVVVRIEKLTPPIECRLVNPKLEFASAI